MKRSSLLSILFAATLAIWQPAQAKPTPNVGVGDALFGCTSVETFGKLVGFAMHRQPQAFAEGLLAGVHTGKCVAFKSSQQVLLADTTTHPHLVQVKLVKNGPRYWTSKQQLDSIKPPVPKHFGNVVTQLYTGKGTHQPLLVMLRGSGGGNDWATERYKDQRAAFIKQGYAILALGYFAGRHHGQAMQGLPENLDRISLNGIHKAILQAAKSTKVDDQCIAVVGSSRGGELALLLGSHFSDIKAVVALKPSDVAYFSSVPPFATSSWYYNAKPVPFVPFDGRALLASLKQKPGASLKPIYDIVRQDDKQLNDAKIHVEDIHGPVLLVSGASDEKWDSTGMSNLIMARLQANNFPFYYEHITVKGGHEAPEKHFDAIRKFLGSYFKRPGDEGCSPQ